jgi:hypothetical protein
MSEQEEWRPIPSLEGYEASSLGRILRRPWKSRMPHGGWRTYGGKAWFGTWDGKRFKFFHGGKNYRVAPLVCEAFNGPAPPGHVCMHGDEDSRNNRPTNLSWGTQKQNLNAPGFLAYCRARRFPQRSQRHA